MRQHPTLLVIDEERQQQVYEAALDFVIAVDEGLKRGTMILRDCWGELLESWPEVAVAIEEGRWPVTQELTQLIQPQEPLLQAA